MLLNPKQFVSKCPDPESREIMEKTIDFFETKGKRKLKLDDHERVWYADFLDFVKKEKIFAALLTPAQYGSDKSGYRWDTWRNCEFNEILAFYALHYWYTWQVSILGLGPIWMGENEEVKKNTAKLLQEGGIFAFGLSEKEHGADIYSTEMALTPNEDGTYSANGRKYYIGNANKAALVSTLGKFKNSGDFVFFVVGSTHGKYECVKNIVNVQSYVAEYALNDYPIYETDILSKGSNAWDSALNTINVGKYNLGWASIGICTHAFFEAINHASHRVLYGKHVTDFPHIKQLFTDAYCRLVSMKAFALRAADYMRSASSEDRRYLLFNPMVKMKVTTQGEEVINLLWDVIAAKGFEKDTYFEIATRDIRALPKLEGTVHVNMALIIKFMRNYFFAPAEFPEIPNVKEPRNDDFLFQQGPTKGLGKIQFHDYGKAYATASGIPNVAVFMKQIDILKELLITSAGDMAATEKQSKDIDFLLTLGELFTLVAYGQLIIEYRNLNKNDFSDELLDQIFDVLVRDFSKYAIQLFSKPSSTQKQMEICLKMVMKPVDNPERFERIWRDYVYALKDSYTMTD